MLLYLPDFLSMVGPVGHPPGSGCFHLYRLYTERFRRTGYIPPPRMFGAVVGYCKHHSRHANRMMRRCRSHRIECWSNRYNPR